MLLNGGCLVLCSENTLLNHQRLKQEISNQQINIMWFTSSWFNQLVDSDITLFAPLKTVLVGGEKLSEPHINKLHTHFSEIEIINGYGPTENTTFSLTYSIRQTFEGHSIPIGKPLNNRTAYILSPEMELLPVGSAGELHLSGAGLARGYLNNETLTKDKFIRKPI
jgi:non-ribosomal peptide synthetase component F